MTFYRCQVELDRDSLTEADRSVFAMYVKSDNVGSAGEEMDDITDSIQQFITAVDAHLSNEMAATGRVTYYDLGEPVERVPLRDPDALTVSAGATGLPSQMSVVIGYRGAYTSGVARARRRGRMYFGPLVETTANAVGERTIDPTIQTALGVAAATLLVTDIPGTSSGSTLTPCVFSRREALDVMGLGYNEGPGGTATPEQNWTTPALTAGFADIIEVNIGDLFGVQRRRRLARPPVRTTYT